MRGFARYGDERDRPVITALVVDDDPDTADVLSELLRLKGITVIGKEHNGLDGLVAFEHRRPDVVFLDVMMKDSDGFYTLDRIRKIQQDAIVILITADVTSKTRERLERLEASAIIYKPYEINEVLDITNKLVISLQQKLSGEIHYKKAVLRKLNQILKNKLHESDTSKLRLLQYFDEREKMV